MRKIFYLLLTLLLAGCASPAEVQQITEVKPAPEMQQITEVEPVQDAQQVYQTERERERQQVANLSIMATTAYEAGDYETAVEYFTKIIDLVSAPAFDYIARGMSYFRMGDYRSALEDNIVAAEMLEKMSDAEVEAAVLLSSSGERIEHDKKYWLSAAYMGVVSCLAELSQMYDRQYWVCALSQTYPYLYRVIKLNDPTFAPSAIESLRQLHILGIRENVKCPSLLYP